MKFIKTCYGGYINPELVKHFHVSYGERRGMEFAIAKADDIPLAYFDVEPVPEGVHKDSWQKTHDKNKCKARAEAIYWLDKLIDGFSNDAIPTWAVSV